MPAFETTLFDVLDVVVELDEYGNITEVVTSDGDIMDLKGVLFPMDMKRKLPGAIIDINKPQPLHVYLGRQIETCMDEFNADRQEHRGPDRKGE